MAWSEFLELYEPVIFRIAKRRNLQDADAREIVQEVLLRVTRAIERFDPDGKGTFRGWLSQTTRRVAVDRFRRLAGRETAVGGVTDWIGSVRSPEHQELESVFDLEHRRQLFHCAAQAVRPQVSQSSWQAFWRTAVDGQSVAEVATALSLSDGAIYIAKCRVLKRIRDFIQQRESE